MEETIVAEKVFKRIEEQIVLLASRGLTIENDTTTKEFLLHNNYYRISGYSLTLRKHDQFYPSATMQNIMDIYNFDHELRHLLLEYLEIIEVKMKSIYAYKLAKAYGSISYQNPTLFSNPTKHAEILAKAERQRQSRLPHEAYLKHFDALGECVPIWAYVDLLTIADISFLYAISVPSLKKSIADAFNLHPTKGSDLLRRFMHSMTIIRNLCAHGSRLYNRIFQQKPSLSKAELTFLRKDANGTLDNAHLYGFLFIMRRMLTTADFNDLKQKLIALSERFPFVEMHYYGFRSDWKKCL